MLVYDGSSMIHLLLLLVVVAATAAAAAVIALENMQDIYTSIHIYVSPNGNVLNVLEVTNTLCGT